jgi:phosphoglycolate phosphatase-like HAD superfamily hydrolase
LVRQHVVHSQPRAAATGRSIEQVIKGTRHLFLDFDGPVCSVFAGIGAANVARQLRDTLTTAGFTLPPEAAATDDPLEVFRLAASVSISAAVTGQQLLTAFETRAIPTAQPTKGSADLIVAAEQTGHSVTIVSNNSGAAIAAYLADHRLTRYIRAIVARDDHDPERMKPDPYRVRVAVGILDADNTECTLVGDSTADVLAGLLAGVTVIGYADRPGKAQHLAEVQAAAVTDDLADMTIALRRGGAELGVTDGT